ncbi:Clp protease N-terminal domain-containing protein [Klenkia sp. PcliD-1-E]|uniref:Clp protease N-terminal domain-containing protein n=1 Tax=Klenkia sp. PcliD-1-E TaxID=2954492 RepID=UPI0020984B18|nr:Clp protease N-terminal domain-containing protein [Klenkia sp. PcliD-1-E]MCO7219748.1 Clp protease [Klenkia sp. PcliD-1-E]
MFERFTTEARTAVVRAEDVARTTGADRVGPVHLLLAVAAGAGTGADALRRAGLDPDQARRAAADLDGASLAALGVDLEQVRELAERTFGAGALDRPAHSGHLRFTEGAKRALQEALRAAVARGRRRLDDGSVLLGVLAVQDAAVVAVLRDQRVDPRVVRDHLDGPRAA